MFESAIIASRNWNRGLNTMGWGFLSLLALLSALTNQSWIKAGQFQTESLNTVQAVLLFVFAIISSNLLGNIGITIGEYSMSRQCPPAKRMGLAYRISEKNLDLLKQSFLEAQFKFESSCGFRGTLLFFILSAFINLPALWSDPMKSEATQVAPLSVLATIFVCLVGLLLMEGSKVAALRDFKAIEETLDKMDSQDS